MRLNMNTYFVKGIIREALIGSHTWQKSIAQKLNIDIEWRPMTKQNLPLIAQYEQHNIEIILNNITELDTSKHWQTLTELGEHIKQLIQAQLEVEYLQIKINIPCAYTKVESAGVLIQFP